MRYLLRYCTVVALLVVVAGVGAVGCGRIPKASPEAQAQASAANDFGFRLFTELAQGAHEPNLFISPLSAHLALSMTYNGAAGDTAQEMSQTLAVAGQSLEEVNAAAEELLGQLGNLGGDQRLLVANSLWADRGTSFLPEFVQACEDSYAARVEAVDFHNPRTIGRINGWVEDKTEGLIPRVVEASTLDQSVLVLVNAVYFLGRWSDPFDRADTEDGPFHLADGTTKTVPLMKREGLTQYYETEEYQAVRLDYQGERARMVIFLPAQGKSPAKVLEGMTEEGWRELMAEDWQGEGRLELPRFEASYKQSLKEALGGLGTEAPFSSGTADSSRMVDPSTVPAGTLFINEVLHKRVLKVNEEGTEAAAATEVVIYAGTHFSPPGFEMIVDRPFVFAIEHVPSGALLFLGTIGNPE